METHLSVESCIESTLNCLKRSADYSDGPTIAQFMILINSIVENPKELTELSNEQLANLGICMSCIMTSNFVRNYPRYYDWKIGEVVTSVGFYAFMKQLDNSYLLHSHYPAFILLIHGGRDYFANLLQDTILINKKKLSFYNILDRIELAGSEQKKYDIAKHFEYMLLARCKEIGYLDQNLDSWFKDILYEIDSIEQRLQTKDSLPQTKQVYSILSNLFFKGLIPDCCKID